jgi:hypothetical protein
MNVHRELTGFIQAHRGCGVARAKAEPTVADGYLLWIDCPCGASFEQWASLGDEDEGLLRSALLEFETDSSSGVAPSSKLAGQDDTLEHTQSALTR